MRVVICGAGIAGLTPANGLAPAGHQLVLLERAPRPRPQGYMIDLFGHGYDAMSAMRLLPALGIDTLRQHVSLLSGGVDK
ncbi:NAD(P)-binding protein [Kribbella sp. NBC_00709]|uniref:NAD(P)-binding protein n=1 Tax=Kribbella sp. NBC_00709 TaxID=2975972 RepID=UPI003FA5A683